MKSSFNYWGAMVLALAVALAGGCSSGGSSTDSTSTTTNNNTNNSIVAGGLAMTFTDGDGVPNVKATPTLTPNSVTSVDTISISLPVDTDVTSITFASKSIDANQTAETKGMNSLNVVQGTIANGIATATLELFPSTAVGYYGVEITANYIPYFGNNASTTYFVGSGTYMTMPTTGQNNPAQTDTAVAYPTFQVTATSTLGNSAAEPVPVPVNRLKKALVKPGSVTYLKVVNSTQGKLYAIHLPVADQSIDLSTSDTTAAGAGQGQSNVTLVGDDSGAGVPFQVSTNSATNYNAASLLVREAAAGTAGAPVALVAKTPLPGAAKGTIPNFYSAPVTSGASYHVTLWGLAPNSSVGTKLSCYNGDALYSSATLTPTSTSASSQGLACLLTANANTAYFKVEGATSAGTAYNLVVQPSPASFGTDTIPAALASGPTGTSSSAGYQTLSYYAFSGAPAKGKATFTNLSAPIFVYFSSGNGNGFNCNLDPIESSSLTCPYEYSAAGTVTVVVSPAAPAGAYFNLKLE